MRKRFTAFAFAAICAALTLVSCDDSLKTNKLSSSGGSLDGEIVFTGTCTAFGATTNDVAMYYVAEEDVYYPAYYYAGEGSFDFKWDKLTNKLSIQECCTGLFYDFYPINTLSQEVYESTLGSDAQPSYYDPVTKTFTFNILYEVKDENGESMLFTDEVKYVVNE